MSVQPLNECTCVHLNRELQHGRLIREEYENTVVNMIRNSIVHRDAEIHGEINIAVIGSGGLFQDYQWLAKLFSGRHHAKTNVDLVDIEYETNDAPVVNTLRNCFVEQIKSGMLSISSWNSCDALLAAGKAHHLIIGMDTEHATPDATKYQWKALIKGDIEKSLIIRWNVDEVGDYYFEIFSRKGSGDLSHRTFFYDKNIDVLTGKTSQYISSDVVNAVLKRIRDVPYTG